MEKDQAALSLFQRAQDRRGLAATWDDMGRVHWLQGAYAEALVLHEQALEVRRELGDERSMAFTLANIGSVHQDQGDFEKALGCFEQALRLREKIGDRPGAVQSCLSIGAVFQHLAESERALGIFQEGLKIAREIGDRQQQAHLLSALADTHRRMGARDQASDLITEATDIGSSLGDERLLSDCERISGLLALDRDQIDAGRDLLIRSLRRAEARGYQGQIGAAERALAEIAVTRSRIHEAEERFERAMGIFSSMGNHLEVARCCDAMAALYDSTGGVDKATKLRESAREIRARLAGAAGRGKA
jgi:tetratricopeptide (TPR) repeat protein